MTTLNQSLYLVRLVGTESYEAGYMHRAVPKLYTLGSAKSVANAHNRQAERLNSRSRWEYVPVTITVGSSS